MSSAGKEAETPDPGSTHVKIPQTTEHLQNYSTEIKDTKTTPMTAALMRVFSFLKASVLLLARKTSKGKATSNSWWVQETNQLIEVILLSLFVYSKLNVQRERMAKLQMLHHSLGPFHTLPP